MNVLDYWNDDKVESMYDKNLLGAEIDLICSKIHPGAKILDAGCGEGEGTLEYSELGHVTAVDFSDTRLAKARERVKDAIFQKVDFLGEYSLPSDFDIVVSQRFLINIMDWGLQKKVILDLMDRLKPGGKLLMLEGSEDGVWELNMLRETLGLPPIPVKWHNLFFKDDELKKFITDSGFKIVSEFGLGEYFLLTRGARPYFDKELNWDSDFNERASIMTGLTKYSRLKLWVIQK